MAGANPVWQSHHSRGSHGKAVTGQKRLSFALEFVVSTFPRRRRGGIGRRAGLKSQRLPLVTKSLLRTVANMNDRERTKATVVRSTCRQLGFESFG